MWKRSQAVAVKRYYVVGPSPSHELKIFQQIKGAEGDTVVYVMKPTTYKKAVVRTHAKIMAAVNEARETAHKKGELVSVVAEKQKREQRAEQFHKERS